MHYKQSNDQKSLLPNHRQHSLPHQQVFNNFYKHKASPLQYYLQRIDSIKQDPSAHDKLTNHFRLKTQTNFNSTMNKYHQESFEQKQKKYEKKRSLSMKTQAQVLTQTDNFHIFNSMTFYGSNNFHDVVKQKFKNTQKYVSENVKQSKKSKYQNIKGFEMRRNSRLAIQQGGSLVFGNKLKTEPNENMLSKSKQSLTNREAANEEHSSPEQVHLQMMQTAKRNIFDKIKSYIEKLDEKGEDELNKILASNYKKRIKSHHDVYLFQTKIKQMIDTNKQIVNLLKQQFLSPKKVKYQHLREMDAFKDHATSEELVHVKSRKVIIDELEVSFEDNQKTGFNNVVPITIEQKPQINLQSYDFPQQQSDLTSQKIDEQTYQAQINHITSEFSTEWKRSQIHKKKVYNKFRKTLFDKFPQFRERQMRLNKKATSNVKRSVDQELQDEFDGFDEVDLGVNKELQKADDSEKERIECYLKKQINENVPKIKNEFSNSLSKISKLSKKDSVSKGSTRTLSIFTEQKKKQVGKINFQQLVDFVFKRAYFYSKSKNKVIQNNAEYPNIDVVPKVQQKPSSISYLAYCSKNNEKKNIRMEKLNEKKLRATGSFLAKNKYKILGIQNQGDKESDFLRKCLEDAIEDYLKEAKVKIK